MNNLPEPEVLKVGDRSIRVYFESEGLKAELDQDLHDKSTLRAVAEAAVKNTDARSEIAIYAYSALNDNGVQFAVLPEADLPKLHLDIAKEKYWQKASPARMLAIIEEDCAHCAFEICPYRDAEYVGDLSNVDERVMAGAISDRLEKMVFGEDRKSGRKLYNPVESLGKAASAGKPDAPPKHKRRRKRGHGRVKHDTHVRRGKLPVVNRVGYGPVKKSRSVR